LGSAVTVSAALLGIMGCGAAARGPGPGYAAPGVPLGFRVVAAGGFSGVTTPAERVARDSEEWRRLWQAHQAATLAQRPLPAVDFSREICVAIFAGERPTGGFAVAVEQVLESPSGVEVVYRVTGPPQGAMVSQALTSPFEIIAVEGRPGTLRFRRLPER
jgi:hypothetical protein